MTAPAAAATPTEAAPAPVAAQTAPPEASKPAEPAAPAAAPVAPPQAAAPGSAGDPPRPGDRDLAAVAAVRAARLAARPPRPGLPPRLRPRQPDAAAPDSPRHRLGGGSPRRLGDPSTPAQASASPTPTGPPVDPRTLRPTATQAVVISRPLIQVRRVTPSSTAHKNIPMAPGQKAIGEVREFKVVPDHLGRGGASSSTSPRTRNRPAPRSATKGNEKDGAFQAGHQRPRLRVAYAVPIRGKKKKPTKKGAKTQITEMAEEKKVIKLEQGITGLRARLSAWA